MYGQSVISQEHDGELNTLSSEESDESLAICGNEVKILEHNIQVKSQDKNGNQNINIEFKVENISKTILGTILFEVVLYDARGEVLDTLEHKTVELKPNLPRLLNIDYLCSSNKKVSSYCIRVLKTALPPKPVVNGDERIKIIYHTHLVAVEGFDKKESRIGLGIRNISEENIASIIFQVVFYDIEGNTLSTVRHKEGYLEAGRSRAIFIVYPDSKTYDKVKSYDVKIVRTTTVDMEKIQLRQCHATATDAGENIEGTVKNISTTKTDIALIATFYDYEMEKVGCKVLIIRDIEPRSIKPFKLLFKPHKGDNVKSFNIGFGDIS